MLGFRTCYMYYFKSPYFFYQEYCYWKFSTSMYCPPGFVHQGTRALAERVELGHAAQQWPSLPELAVQLFQSQHLAMSVSSRKLRWCCFVGGGQKNEGTIFSKLRVCCRSRGFIAFSTKRYIAICAEAFATFTPVTGRSLLFWGVQEESALHSNT